MKPSTSVVSLALVLVVIPSTLAQFFDPSGALQPPPLQQQLVTFPTGLDLTPGANLGANIVQPSPRAQLAHHAVLRNAADEDRLPDELKNNFYKNPQIVEALAKESWFTPGEMPVVDREAEKIPRDQVFKLLKNAGLARR